MNRFKFVSLLSLGILLIAAKAPQNTGKLFLTPEKSSAKPSETITMELRFDVKKTPVNTVQAVLQFPADLLRVKSVDAAGSAFEIQAEETKGEGSLRLVRGTRNRLTGSHPVAKITFETVRPGTARIALSTGTVLLSSENSLDVLKDKLGATVEIK